MPVDPKRAYAALQTGLSPICASCERYWEGIDKGESGCNRPCGGPLANQAFPEYKGPMTNFERFCFACVAEADFGIKQPDSDRVLGVCRKHLRLLDTHQVLGGEGRFDVVSAKIGLVMPVNGRYTNKTLFEAMAEDEAEWAESEGES